MNATGVDGPSAADRRVKRERVLALLDEHAADSIVLRSHGAVAWYLDGARTHVSLAGDPIVAVVVRRGGDEVRVFANEADRLEAEELDPADAAAITRVPWDGLLAPTGSADLEEVDATDGLRAARASLLPGELARYRALGRTTAEVLTDAAYGLDPQDTERAVAARVAQGLVAAGIDPLVVLVAGVERLRHRHPLPTGEQIGRRAILVACGRRHGLIANATRWVRFGAADPAEADAGERILAVEAEFLRSSRVGSTVGAAFAAGTAAYPAHGFDADEWRRHHQGGAAGYVGRDPRGNAAVADRVQENHAFAWNPSAPGAKVEDTVLVTAGGVEVVTVDPRWPVAVVEGLGRPLELERAFA